MRLRAEYGARLRLARVKAGYSTIGSAAAAAGVSDAQLTQWETGRSIPSVPNLDGLIHSLGLDSSIILAGPKHRTR